MNIEDIKKEQIEICRRIYGRGLVQATGGNVSVRIAENEILIKPTGFCLGDLTVSDLVKVDLDCNVIEGKIKPSSEVLMHTIIYKTLKSIRAVIHSHAPVATGFAKANMQIEPYAGSVPIPILVIPYAKPGTQELADNVKNFILGKKQLWKDRDFLAFLLENHGVLTMADNLRTAYYLLELVEEMAQVSFTSLHACTFRSLRTVKT